MPHIRLPARIQSLTRLLEFVSGCAHQGGFSPDRVREVQLAAEEILVNIFNNAYPTGQEGDVEIRCRSAGKNRLVLEILDSGVPFDPVSLDAPELHASLADRKIGGLGVFLARKMASEMHHRRAGEMNILTLAFEREKGS